MTYLGATDEMIFKMKLEKDSVLRRFHIILDYIGFSMGTWKVAIITLLASFKFSGVFINHCSANMLQTKESTHKKDNNQNSVVEKYFFDYKKEMV